MFSMVVGKLCHKQRIKRECWDLPTPRTAIQRVVSSDGDLRPRIRRSRHCRNRRLLRILGLGEARQIGVVAHSRHGISRAVRLPTHARGKQRRRASVCCLRWHLHCCVALLAVGCRRLAPRPVGCDGSCRVPGRCGNHPVRPATSMRRCQSMCTADHRLHNAPQIRAHPKKAACAVSTVPL